ncbi:GNAT family N-acetyltransferase [Microbacterium gorillae]|uniref:GNAT family N-acetyltransferase n=1 Tax=Microbacterium gorillae TaxID=1231063 RepID=UPI0006944562|nr:GNAT family N-acetyltransferase [Microbacterium gorillae]
MRVLPPWPEDPPGYGGVILRAVGEEDVALAQDPYIPQTSTLPPHASDAEARAWVERQRARHAEGVGFSFAVALLSGVAVGHCGLWLDQEDPERARAGYAIAPSARGNGYAADALAALTAFAWTLPALRIIDLLIEPWNAASIRTAERAGYAAAGTRGERHVIGGEERGVRRFTALRPSKLENRRESRQRE